MKLLLKSLILIALTSVCHARDDFAIARVSLDQATQQIIRDGNKRVLGATTEIIDGRAVHIIKVLTPDGRIQHYKIDAETGALIS
ncbi:PepSY domain-containing protein [Methyloglobulus sp.]|uniref:PepSY domain-containing protein n=1 Tax=Methyloglobulus sp. TaxID=2518622 RepID=UPI00398975D1